MRTREYRRTQERLHKEKEAKNFHSPFRWLRATVMELKDWATLKSFKKRDKLMRSYTEGFQHYKEPKKKFDDFD